MWTQQTRPKGVDKHENHQISFWDTSGRACTEIPGPGQAFTLRLGFLRKCCVKEKDANMACKDQDRRYQSVRKASKSRWGARWLPGRMKGMV